jgi:hypothetical protein
VVPTVPVTLGERELSSIEALLDLCIVHHSEILSSDPDDGLIAVSLSDVFHQIQAGAEMVLNSLGTEDSIGLGLGDPNVERHLFPVFPDRGDAVAVGGLGIDLIDSLPVNHGVLIQVITDHLHSLLEALGFNLHVSVEADFTSQEDLVFGHLDSFQKERLRRTNAPTKPTDMGTRVDPRMSIQVELDGVSLMGRGMARVMASSKLEAFMGQPFLFLGSVDFSIPSRKCFESVRRKTSLRISSSF